MGSLSNEGVAKLSWVGDNVLGPNGACLWGHQGSRDPSEADGFLPLLADLRALCLLSQCMSDGARGIKVLYSRLTQSEFI